MQSISIGPSMLSVKVHCCSFAQCKGKLMWLFSAQRWQNSAFCSPRLLALPTEAWQGADICRRLAENGYINLPGPLCHCQNNFCELRPQIPRPCTHYNSMQGNIKNYNKMHKQVIKISKCVVIAKTMYSLKNSEWHYWRWFVRAMKC